MELINTDLIIKYTDKELSKTEELKFEKNLIHDKSMRQELEIHKHLDSFMKRRFRLEQNPEKDMFYNDADQFAKEAKKFGFEHLFVAKNQTQNKTNQLVSFATVYELLKLFTNE